MRSGREDTVSDMLRRSDEWMYADKAEYYRKNAPERQPEVRCDLLIRDPSVLSIENIRMAKELGFGGVCICGDLWNRFSIQHELNFKELIEHFRKLRKAVG